MPRVSVVVPAFNAAGSVAQTLASVLAQSEGDYEVVVVDDGSTDGTGDIVRAIGDARIRCIRQDNAGVSAARNAGIAAAGAPWIAFLDADDLWTPHHLRVLLEAAGQHPKAGLIGNAYRAVPADWSRSAAATPAPGGYTTTHLDDYIATWARQPAPFHTSTCMVRRALAQQLGGFKVGYSRGEDLEFFVRASLAAPVVVTDYIGGYYRRSTGGLTSRTVARPDVCMATLAELAASHPDKRQQMAEFSAKLAIAHALDCLLAGDRASARRFLDGAAQTRWHRRRWRAVSLLSRVPGPLSRSLLSLRKAAKLANPEA